jgi:hypothetical protein
MSATPRTGVVDADCRVHGVSNLYLAGGGVFTTSRRAFGHGQSHFSKLVAIQQAFGPPPSVRMYVVQTSASFRATSRCWHCYVTVR